MSEDVPIKLLWQKRLNLYGPTNVVIGRMDGEAVFCTQGVRRNGDYSKAAIEVRNSCGNVLWEDTHGTTNRIWQSESSDVGFTWSAPHQTPLRGYPPHLLRLRNGWLLSTYAKRWTPYGQYACISRDNGKTWDVDNEIRLSSAPSDDLGYPASVQLSDGSIWTVYYEVDRLGERPCLKGTHWRIKE